MKITINKIAILHTGIVKIGELKLPLRTAWAVHKIANELSEKLKFLGNEEKKIIEKHNGEITADGQIKFKTEEHSKEAVNELNAFHLEELDCDFEPVEIAFDDVGDGRIEPNIFTILDGVVMFK